MITKCAPPVAHSSPSSFTSLASSLAMTRGALCRRRMSTNNSICSGIGTSRIRDIIYTTATATKSSSSGFPVLISSSGKRRYMSNASASAWRTVPLAPPDKILGLNDSFKSDPNKDKVNLGVGAYRDDHGKPVVLPSVLQAERNVSSRNEGHEYASIQVNLAARVRVKAGLGLKPYLPSFLPSFFPSLPIYPPCMYIHYRSKCS